MCKPTRSQEFGSIGLDRLAKIYIVGESPGEIEPDTQVILCMDSRFHYLSEEIRMRVGHLVIDEADRYCTIGHMNGLLSTEPLFILH